MDPSESQQLKGKQNARQWKQAFKVAAHAKGVWDVFTGVFAPAECPDPVDFNLAGTPPADASEDDKTKGAPKSRTTLDATDVIELVKRANNKGDGMDFSSRLSLYKFRLEE
jgi:hypothetical protein